MDLVLDQAEGKPQDASTGAHENIAAASTAVFEETPVEDQAASGVEAPQSHQAQAQAPAAVGGSMMPQALMNSGESQQSLQRKV